MLYASRRGWAVSSGGKRRGIDQLRGCERASGGRERPPLSLMRGRESDGQPMAGWRDGELVYTDKHLVIRHTIPGNGLSLTGSIDLFNVDSVIEALASQLEGQGDLHLDLSQVEFCDVSGIRAVVSAAEKLDGDRSLVLHGLPPLLRKVMTVVGWGELPRLSVCKCGGDQA